MRFFITIAVCVTLYSILIHAPHWVHAINVLTTMLFIRIYIVTKRGDNVHREG